MLEALCVCVCVCVCVMDLIKKNVLNDPDITIIVDWAFKNNFFPCFIV